MEKSITWPVICFSQGIMEVCSDLEDWGESNMLGVASGWYKKMEFIDSKGNVFSVKEITTVPQINIFNRLLFSIINRKMRVKLVQYKLKFQISLAEFKILICKEIDVQEKQGNYWSSGGDTIELKNKISNSLNFEEVMILLS